MIAQGSDEWFAQRLGRLTASRMADVIARTKDGYSTSREKYMVELALERITGARQEAYSNAAMEWGTNSEPLARAAYEADTGFLVVETGMVAHPRIAMAGASPDGLVNHDGLLEIKCPQSATHVRNLCSGKPEGRYVAQMMWQMACTGRDWCDFVSYDPRMPDGLQLMVTRIERDDKRIQQLEEEAEKFLSEVDAMVQRLLSMREERQAA